MKPHLAIAIAAIALAPLGAAATTMPAVNGQPPSSTTSPSSTTLTSSELDQLVAPIALYPDAVLTDILAAATYPAQVVEANRFASDPANNGLQGAALASAAASHDWDPSVVALLQFPQVLQMMDDDLEWTEHLGQAFMDQQTGVMNAVQSLRQEAERAGTLASGPMESVVDDAGSIVINPPAPQEIYLPTYDASGVYGPAPDCDAADDELGWDTGIFLPYGYWQWGGLDWRHHRIRFDRGDGGHLHASTGYGAGRFGNQGDGAEWRHTGPRNFGSYHVARVGGGDFGGFHYAPSAVEPLHGTGITGGFARGTGMTGGFGAPAHFNAGPFFRAPAMRAPMHFAAAPSVGFAHGGGFAGHR
jgi:hypothetical protein